MARDVGSGRNQWGKGCIPPKTALDDQTHICLLYIIAPDINGPCKIGVTSNIKLRLGAIQNGCWLQLRVYSARVCFRRDAGFNSLSMAAEAGAYKVENLCHKKLMEFDLHLMGEWFDITVQDAISVVERVGNQSGTAALSIEMVAGLELPDYDRMSIKTRDEIVTSLAIANEFITMGLDEIG